MTMKAFKTKEVREAIAHAAAGGQGLHLHQLIVNRPKAPRCFVDAVEREQWIAHLFDLNRERLIHTAKRLGVRVIVVEREGTDRQHIDLCGGPLRKALAMCRISAVAELMGKDVL